MDNMGRDLSFLSLALLLACLAIRPLLADGADEVLFTLQDLSGDDHGGGALVYPANEHYRRGDLDLLSFSARRAGDGVWFSITLANAVRGTAGVTLGMGVGFVPAQRVARHDFYTFNVEVYIDQDGVRGVGRTDTLPGRGISIAPEFAWERAVIVTPRPKVARNIMRALHDERAGGGRRYDKDGGYIYTEKIRVRHNRLDFFVSEAALGGIPQRDWAYTVFITGAELMRSSSFLSSADKNAGLMLRGARLGRPADQFGLRFGDPQQPPIVDYLHPLAGKQERLLSGGQSALVGVVPNGTVRPILTARQGASLPVLPTGAAQSADERQQAQARRAREAATRRDLALARARIKQLQQQGENIKGDTLPERLTALRKMYEQNIINEQEYRQIRQRILSEDL